MTKKQKYSPNARYTENKPADDEVELVNLDINEDDADIAPVPIENYLEDEALLDLILVDSEANSKEEETEPQESEDEKQIEDVELDVDEDNSNQFSVEPVDQPDTNDLADFDFLEDELIDTSDLEENDVENGDKQVLDDQVFLNKPIVESDEYPEFDYAALDDMDYVDPIEPVSVEKSQDHNVDNAAALEFIKQALLNDTRFISTLTKDEQAFKPYIPPTPTTKRSSSINTIVLVTLGLIVLGLSVKVLMLSTDVSKLQSLTSILEEDVTLLQEKKQTNTPTVNQVPPDSAPSSNQLVVQNPQPTEHVTAPVVITPPIITAVDKAAATVNANKSVETVVKKPKLSEKIENRPVIKEATKKTLPKAIATKVTLATSKSAAKKEYVFVPWAVNLVAFKNETEAKKRSSKLISQGIPVKISSFHTTNGIWYQLKVDGFKTRDNAESYANKLRKSINLNSISVVVN